MCDAVDLVSVHNLSNPMLLLDLTCLANNYIGLLLMITP